MDVGFVILLSLENVLHLLFYALNDIIHTLS